MKLRVLLAVAGFCTAITPPALALTSLARVTPKNLTAEGFTFAARKQKGAKISVHITRDTTQELSQHRFATLEIPSETGTTTPQKVAGKQEGKRISYRFSLPPGKFQQARFRVQEGGGELPGAIFEFRLAEFQDSVSPH